MEMIKPGDIIFSRSNTLCSKFFRMITLSQWSHVGIIIGRHRGKITCVSSRFNGVVYDNLVDWGSDIQILRVKNITECQINKMINYITTQVGKPCILMNMSGCKFNSMLVYMSLLKAGIDIFKDSHKRGFITIGDLYENPRLEFVTEI